MATTEPSTYERILAASLKLFNEQGFANVPALRIAMQLGISPGNLQYHFKSKDDIVIALFPKIEEELNRDIWDTTKPGEGMSPYTAAHQQIEVFRSLWRYRFVFNAMNRMMTEGGAELRTRYRRLQENILAAIYGLFDNLIEQGQMRPIPPPNSTRLIARSIWMMYLGWLRFEQIENPRSENVGSAAIFSGIMQNFSILQPYLDPAFSDAMFTELHKALPDEEVIRSGPRRAAANSGRTGRRGRQS